MSVSQKYPNWNNAGSSLIWAAEQMRERDRALPRVGLGPILSGRAKIEEAGMLDHIGVTVADFERASAFYRAALKPLGLGVVMEGRSGRQ